MKIRLVMTMVYEFEPVVEHYPENCTPEEMVAIDITGLENDPYMYMESPIAIITYAGEVVNY